MEKKQIKWFTIFEYEKEQEYLRKMQLQGWKFVKIRGLGVYHFESCEPQDVVYQLDYSEEGQANKEEYLKMFQDCGWEYIQDYAGYSYFRKPVSSDGVAEEIFCDDESRLQMMQRVVRGRLMPLMIILLCVLIPQFCRSISDPPDYVVAGFIGAVMLMYLGIFISYLVQYHRYKHRNG